jgi:hypothetical protein
MITQHQSIFQVGFEPVTALNTNTFQKSINLIALINQA